jgi:methylated-DNA-[protein]-cysteine S-methyltransferase
MTTYTKMYSSTMDTPAGPFTLLVDDEGRVLASGWTSDVDSLLPLVHPSLRARQPYPQPYPQPRHDVGPATRAVRAYHRGEVHAPDGVEVHQHCGGAFVGAAWDTLRTIDPGAPVSYAELAARTGNPRATRAAAQACARNAAALFVPCHRVVRSDGSLGGFRWGMDVKRWLLTHEQQAHERHEHPAHEQLAHERAAFARVGRENSSA